MLFCRVTSNPSRTNRDHPTSQPQLHNLILSLINVLFVHSFVFSSYYFLLLIHKHMEVGDVSRSCFTQLKRLCPAQLQRVSFILQMSEWGPRGLCLEASLTLFYFFHLLCQTQASLHCGHQENTVDNFGQ